MLGYNTKPSENKTSSSY